MATLPTMYAAGSRPALMLRDGEGVYGLRRPFELAHFRLKASARSRATFGVS
jgi:hypothetical protein